MTDRNEFPPLAVGLVRLALRLGLILVVAFAIHMASDWAARKAEAAGSEGMMIGLFSLLLVSYALLIAVPFMPGIEIGISLLIMKGADIAPMVYGATVIGLTLAFLVGRFTPYRWLHAVLADLRLRSACDMVERLEPMSQQERLSHLTARLPRWLVPMVGTGRYLLLALLLNIPGNAVIGGGGGITFIAGVSRLFAPTLTTVAIALAVLPVPLVVWITGNLDWIAQ